MLGDGDYLVSLIAVAPEADGEALARAIGDALAGHAGPGVRGAAGELPNGAGALARILAADAISGPRRAALRVGGGASGAPRSAAAGAAQMTVRRRATARISRRPQFRDRRRVEVPVAWDEAARRRLRREAADGTDVVIDLDDGAYLFDGAVLSDDGSRVLVVSRPLERALVVRLDLELPASRASRAGAVDRSRIRQSARAGRYRRRRDPNSAGNQRGDRAGDD